MVKDMYEKINKSNYTPMMQQYLDIKEKYPDTLVFFRLGDFYEMFFNDALVASKELEIVLTSRDAGVNNDPVPMCGVPFHAVSGYIERLSEKGYKVAIVEQLEAPGISKIVKRDVIKVITPGTNIDEQYLNEKDNNYLGVIERLSNNSFAFGYIDLSTGEAKITNIPTSDMLYSEIIKLGIKEVVIGKSISKQMSEYLSKVLALTLSENDSIDVDSYLDELYKDINDDLKIASKRLLNYLVTTQKRVLIHLKKFVEYSINDFLKIDSASLKSLELVESIKGDRNRNNLFSVLDHCQTAMGSRYLKKNILYPLINLNEINERLDLIEEFNRHMIAVADLKNDLSSVYDLERIIGRISYGNLSPKDLVQLKKTLFVIPHLKRVMLGIKGKVAKSIAQNINEFTNLETELSNALNDEVPYLLRDGGVIKAGYNEELDKIRNINSTNKDFLINFEKEERERTGIKSLKVGFNKVFGYYIEVTKANLSLVKDEYGYIRKQTTSNAERYITSELKERESLILRSDERSIELEVELFNHLREMCKEVVSDLQVLAEIIAKIDMLISLSDVSKNNHYVRPKFSYYDEFEIIKGRHPVIEYYNNFDFIENDLKLYNNERVLLITGPNMSGKSTYMRQNALIVIMAQMGSFVPCESCTLPIFDQVFTRIGSSDDITSGESTFMSEMLEVNRALQNATCKSLILFDEVGRGTATFDGMALAQAIIEYLHDEIAAKTFFSTHYHELTHLDTSLPFLRNVHVEALAENNQITFLHKVIDGPTDQSYGINVAGLAKIPMPVILRATDLLKKLTEGQAIDVKMLSKENYISPVVKVVNNSKYDKIIEDVKGLDLDSLRPIDALNYLVDLKNKVGE